MRLLGSLQKALVLQKDVATKACQSPL